MSGLVEILQEEPPGGMSKAGQVALAAARSALRDGRDVGPNTVAVLVLELQRLAGICPVCYGAEHERVEYKPGVFVTGCPAVPDGWILPDGSIERRPLEAASDDPGTYLRCDRCGDGTAVSSLHSPADEPCPGCGGPMRLVRGE